MHCGVFQWAQAAADSGCSAVCVPTSASSRGVYASRKELIGCVGRRNHTASSFQKRRFASRTTRWDPERHSSMQEII
ncbi:unnamed protein product [Camellia sinensis]